MWGLLPSHDVPPLTNWIRQTCFAPGEPQVNKEYYTITASGVVYVPGDKNFETEFIPIGEWLRETGIYNLMRTLRFFKYYFSQKMFRIWRKV